MEKRWISDPTRPFRDVIDRLRIMITAMGREDASVHPLLSDPDVLGLRALLRAERAIASPIDELMTLCRRLEDLTEQQPGKNILAAPMLDRWCPIVDGGCAVLIGVVSGHPVLRLGARTRTSPVLRIALEERWARTWSRYYRLGTYDPTLFDEMRADGRLDPEAGQIDMNRRAE